MRSNSLNSLVLASSVFLGACANPARDLPPDLGALEPSQRLLPEDHQSGEYSLSCADLLKELDAVTAKAAAEERHLQQARNDNQSKSVAGLLVLTPIWLTMDNAEETKKALAELSIRKERVRRIAQAKGCVH